MRVVEGLCLWDCIEEEVSYNNFFFCFSNFQLVTCEKHILLYQKFINIIIICNANLEHMLSLFV